MNIVFKKSAFEHKKTEASIRQAFENPRYDGPIEEEGYNNRFLRIGFDDGGNLLETMTEEEAFALDEYYTKNPPKIDPSKARIRIPMVRVDNATAEYLSEKAKAAHKTPGDIISEMVQKEIAAAI